MKYLKKFEELSPETYKAASRELNKIGRSAHGAGWHKVKPEDNDFKKRANDLDNWADIVRWKKEIEELSKTSTKITINVKGNKYSGSKKIDYTADFYLNFFFDRDCFSETFEEDVDSGEIEIQFCVQFVPVDKKSLEICETEGNTEITDYYTHMDMMWLGIRLKVEGNRMTFDGLRISNDTEYGDVQLNRAIIGRIRTTLINMFTEGNKLPTGYTDINDMYKMIENTVMIESGLSSEYGITMDYIKDELTKLTPNLILANYKR